MIKQNIRVSSNESTKTNTISLDGLETAVLLKDFAQHLKREDEALPDMYLTLLDAVSVTPDLVINSYAKAKERKDWIRFKI